jgi:hypothetical protein
MSETASRSKELGHFAKFEAVGRLVNPMGSEGRERFLRPAARKASYVSIRAGSSRVLLQERPQLFIWPPLPLLAQSTDPNFQSPFVRHSRTR